MSYTLVLEWMPGDLYMSAVTARCTAPTSSYSVVWLPPNKVYQITLYCGSTSLVSFLVGAFRGKAWSYMKDSYEQRIQNQFGAFCVRVLKNEARHIQRDYASLLDQEKPLDELTASELEQTAVWDDYFMDEHVFEVLGLPVVVTGNVLADALAQLPEGKRDVILLSYFLGMTDREISEKLHIVHQTVSKRRLVTLKELYEYLVKEGFEWPDM